MSPLSQTISLNLFNSAFDINLGPSSWKRCDAVVKTSKKSFCIDVGSPVSIRGHPHEQAWVYQTAHVLQLFGASGFVWPNLATISCKVFDRGASTFTSPENQFYSCYRFEQHLNTSQVILGFSIVVLLMFCANEHRNLERQSRICCYVKYGWKQCLIFGEEGTPSARLEWSRLKITRRKSVVSIFTMARSAIVIVSVSRLKSKQAEIPRNSTDVNKFNLHPFAKKKPFFLVWRLIKGNGRGCGEPITCTGRASP